MPGGCAVSETGVVPDPAIKNTLRFEFIRGFGELCDARGRENHQPASPGSICKPRINLQAPDQSAGPESIYSPSKVNRVTNSTGLVCFWRVSRFESYSYYNLITVAVPLNGELTHPSQRSFCG